MVLAPILATVPNRPLRLLACCLVDRCGVIVASDGRIQSWLDEAPPRARWTLADLLIDGVVPGLVGQPTAASPPVCIDGSDVSWTSVLAIGESAGQCVQVDLRRLSAPSGPLLLVTLHAHEHAAVESRDPLTGLPDRRAVAERIACWRNCDPVAPFAVLLIDLDDFKRINDRYGHLVGDCVLAEVASRWPPYVREGDLVARYGGDEFVVLLRDVAALAGVQPVQRRLQEATALPIAVGEQSLRITASVGAAIAHSPLDPWDELLAAADRQMYDCKRRRPR